MLAKAFPAPFQSFVFHINFLNYSGVERAVSSHRAILDAIRARDAQAARSAMLKHLRHATHDLKGIQSCGR
jgi:DNA-binding FadR family transcriptional regulator